MAIRFLEHAVNLARHAVYNLSSKRSPKWASVRDAYLKQHPTCAACGSTKRLDVHHIKPFHLHPELELDQTNFITLCMDTEECHLMLGHGDDFSAYNPKVVEDASDSLAHPDMREDIRHVAKAGRQYNPIEQP